MAVAAVLEVMVLVGQARRAVPEVREEVDIYMSTISGIRRTTDGFRIPKIYSEAWRLTVRDTLWMGTEITKTAGLTGQLPGMACKFSIVL